MSYETYNVTIANHVAIVAFNRPTKANCLIKKSWEEMQTIFEDLDENPEVRAIILTGEGKHFCGGIDLSMLMEVGATSQKVKDTGRRGEHFIVNTLKMQANVSAIEKCRKPVIAAIHKACVGAGVDIIAACDMRYCTADSYFGIKEIDWGMVADIGTLQRLPKIINPGIVAEWAYTGRNVNSTEAEKTGLVAKVYTDKAEMMENVTKLAATIASKSPISVRGTKEMLLYARDNSVENALKYQVVWNASMIFSNDMQEAFQASMQKRAPKFEN